MITQNLHMHSTWDDGSCSVEEMIAASRAAGLTSVGLSVHGPMPFENSWECPRERLPAYIAEVRAMQKKYAGMIDVYLGIEWDATADDLELSIYDYVIGSVHEIPVPGGGTRSADSNPQTTRKCILECFGGDADAAAEAYFAELAKVANKPEADIVGHFDLLTKFDEMHGFYNENSPRYRRAAERVMEGLVRAGKIFEVNTGAISRGYRTTPYPSAQWLHLLHEMGGKVTVSADAHHTSGVTCAFDVAEKMIKDAGFTEIWILQKEKFVPVSI
ncbi:MAG: histidinol-phosphatase HisJ family protein [Clostridia bacterium]|nr:histidinol-phosphatase HisJ family protein [Clostridia bacterium]